LFDIENSIKSLLENITEIPFDTPALGITLAVKFNVSPGKKL
jgi:hypothetical protein